MACCWCALQCPIHNLSTFQTSFWSFLISQGKDESWKCLNQSIVFYQILSMIFLACISLLHRAFRYTYEIIFFPGHILNPHNMQVLLNPNKFMKCFNILSLVHDIIKISTTKTARQRCCNIFCLGYLLQREISQKKYSFIKMTSS